MRLPPKAIWMYIVTTVLLLATVRGCTKAPQAWDKVPGGPTKVLVTIPPLYSLAKSVAGDDAAVLCLLDTRGPHDFQPNHLDALKARKANVFLSIGLGLDEFSNKIINSSGNSKIVALELGEQALEPKKLLLASAEHDEHEAKEEKGHHHHHGEFDPHVWLGIEQADAMVDFLAGKFRKIDPKNKDAYAKRAAAYREELKKLKQDGLDELKTRKNKKLIAMHDSLAYFAKSFGLEIVGSIQPQAGVEADASKLKELAKLCKDRDVRVVAIEPQFQAGAAEALKKHLAGKGIDIDLVTVDPMETVAPADLDAGYYIRTMHKNIHSLAEKLR